MSCEKENCGDNCNTQKELVPSPTYMIEGGLGKMICFSAMINDLAKKSSTGVINIISPYPDVFAWNEKVQVSFSLDQQGHPDFKALTTELVYREPYKSNFQIDGDGHLLKYWARELGIEYNNKWLPVDVNVQDEATLSRVNSLKDELGDFIIVQFTGGQPAVGFDPESEYQNNHMQIQRNYPYGFAQTLINKIKIKYPDLNIIDFSLPNEHHGYQGASRIELPYIGYSELVKHAKAVIGIDSSLLHMASAANKKGIGLFGGCPAWQFGWSNMKNITNFRGTPSEFDPNDPWNISIDSNVVMKELNKLF